MTPYFQLFGIVDANTDETAVAVRLNAAISELSVAGLEMSITKLPKQDAMILWTVKVPGVNDNNERQRMSRIEKTAKQHRLQQRFRFPSFFKLHGQGGAQT